jgi:hypothetical protein
MVATPAETRIDLDFPDGAASRLVWPMAGRAAVGVYAPITRRLRAYAALVALGPFEGAARMPGGPPLFGRGTLLRLEAPLTKGRTTSLLVRVTACGTDGLFWFRLPGPRSVTRAALVMLVWCQNFSLQDARRRRIRVRGASALLDTRVVETNATFAQALEVRLRGNQAFGRLSGVRDASTLADDLDPHSTHFICWLGKKAVGTGRVVVNGGDRSRSECERGAGLPNWLWEEGFVEASRFAVCPKYRNGGILFELFRQAARIALKERVRYIVLDCIEKLIPMYRRVGAKPLGLSKTHPYGAERVIVMYVDLEESLTRLGYGLFFWLIIFGPVVNEMRHGDAFRYYEQRMTLAKKWVWDVKKLLSIVATAVLRFAGW